TSSLIHSLHTAHIISLTLHDALPIYHMRYPIKDSDDFIEIATTRPETMLGETAIAVHPEDERYQHLHGKKVILPIVGREIEIVRSEEHTSELQSRFDLVCRLLLEKKK